MAEGSEKLTPTIVTTATPPILITFPSALFTDSHFGFNSIALVLSLEKHKRLSQCANYVQLCQLENEPGCNAKLIWLPTVSNITVYQFGKSHHYYNLYMGKIGCKQVLINDIMRDYELNFES